MLTNICALGPHLIFNNTYLARHKVGAKLNRIDVLVFTATVTPPTGSRGTLHSTLYLHVQAAGKFTIIQVHIQCSDGSCTLSVWLNFTFFLVHKCPWCALQASYCYISIFCWQSVYTTLLSCNLFACKSNKWRVLEGEGSEHMLLIYKSPAGYF